MSEGPRFDPKALPPAEREDEQRTVGDSEKERLRRLKLIPILPSLLTLGNLFCGFLSIAYVTDAVRAMTTAQAGSQAAMQAGREIALGRLAAAGWVIFLAMIFDALDGRVARITGQVSVFGGELDSLADMVTFGVAPAFMTKVLAEDFYGFEKHRLALGFSVIFVLCAALRLARYNVETDPEEGGHYFFMGLPTPGAAGMVAAIALLYTEFASASWSKYLIGALPFMVPVLGLLMFSRIRYPHVMNQLFKGPKPMKYLVYLGFLVALVLVVNSVQSVLAGLLLAYVLFGPARFLFRLATGKAARGELDIFD